VLPVPFRRDPRGRLLVEKQACNGLDRWADNFHRIVVASPVEPVAAAARSQTTGEYRDADEICSRDRIEFVPLPWAYTLGSFLKTYRPTRALLGETIVRCDYLCFAIGGLVGDWGSVAALEAIAQGRPYAIWTDRVEHMVIRGAHLDVTGPRRLYRRIKNNLLVSPLMKRLECHVITRSALGLFHGRGCYEGYASYCHSPQLVHNVHLKPRDRISPDSLAEKTRGVRSAAPLRLVYAGRAVGMKGPFDWLHVMAELRGRGVAFRATWLGDGPLLAEMRAEAARLGLADVVELPGFIGDRVEVLDALRSADLLVFCHKTQESPRCLIESMMSGTPIVGYATSFARDLLGVSADRLLVPRDDATGLASRIADLDRDRTELARLQERCAELGSHYSDADLFRHRSELIHRFLASSARPAALPVGVAGHPV
jgi:glycosyltransferase involved in cell wall biosynthesis